MFQNLHLIKNKRYTNLLSRISINAGYQQVLRFLVDRDKQPFFHSNLSNDGKSVLFWGFSNQCNNYWNWFPAVRHSNGRFSLIGRWRRSRIQGRQVEQRLGSRWGPRMQRIWLQGIPSKARRQKKAEKSQVGKTDSLTGFLTHLELTRICCDFFYNFWPSEGLKPSQP